MHSTIRDVRAEYVLQVSGISKRFGEITALKPLSLDVRQGEYLTLLGPSGCGKTTLLRIIAGLETPDSGTIHLNRQRIDQSPAHERDVHTVFQNYALFPHLTVAENVAFSLSLAGVGKAETKSRVEEVLSAVGLPGFGTRRTHQMSGGQQQRVALARALVSRPSMLLLDEPFGALDVQLRKDLQLEMKRIHREFGIAFIHVTHDQEEALTLSDRIVVMRSGSIEQIGTPSEVYKTPTSTWVASFVGRSNIIQGEVVAPAGGGSGVRLQNGVEFGCDVADHRRGERVALTIRPESMTLRRPGETGSDTSAVECTLPSVVRDVLFTGPLLEVVVECEKIGLLICYLLPTDPLVQTGVEIGEQVLLSWRHDQRRILPLT